MSEPNELSFFEFRAPRVHVGPVASTTVGAVEYHPFAGGGRDGLICRSQGVWLMIEAMPIIEPGGFITGERRRLLIAPDGFAPDPETGRWEPKGPVVAEYGDHDVLPDNVAFIVREAARQFDLMGGEA